MWTRTILPVGAGDVSVRCATLRGLDSGAVSHAIHTAIEVGIDLFDVAAEEPAERLVGDAIRSLRVRDRVLAAVRIPALVERAGAPTRDVLTERLPLRYIQDRVESALRTTHLDALPLAQLDVRAFWRSSSAWPELAGTCARLVREGKVLEWCAFVDAIEDDTPELANEAWLVALSVPYSLCERAAEPVLAAALEKKLAVFARRPLAGGALAGTLGPGIKLRLHDDRRTIDDATLTRIAAGAAKLAVHAKHTPIAAYSCDAGKAQLERNVRPEHVECETIAELALRYVTTRGAIALPRLHRREHVPSLLASIAPLPRDLVEKLDI